VGFVTWLDALWRQVPAWGWLGGAVAAVLLALLAALLMRARTQRRLLESLDDQLRAVVRAVWQSEAAVAQAAMAIEHRAADLAGGADALPEPERERLVRWIAAGQHLMGLVRAALQDYERAQREADAARRQNERLRRELARLQGEHDRLLRERRQLAQALATFVHDPGPRVVLDAPPAAEPDHAEGAGNERGAPQRPPTGSGGDECARDG
jgi:hypothetical protein